MLIFHPPTPLTSVKVVPCNIFRTIYSISLDKTWEVIRIVFIALLTDHLPAVRHPHAPQPLPEFLPANPLSISILSLFPSLSLLLFILNRTL